MNNFSFLKKEMIIMIGTLYILTLFALVFALFRLDFRLFWIVAGIVFLSLVLYLGRAYYIFKRTLSMQEELAELKKAIQSERTASKMYQKDLEDYFLTWIHQIKTPISASSILIDKIENPQLKYQLTAELMEIENYTHLALYYLKVISPGQDLNATGIRLYDLISALLKRYRWQFIQKKLSVKLDIASDAIVISDQQSLSVMIEQILNNALKYTNNGGITLRYDPKQQILTIKDTGKGIRPDDLPKIFEKGYAGFNGQVKEKSSGIGLYVVKLIAERLNHAVSVESEMGKGSIFKIHLKEKGSD